MRNTHRQETVLALLIGAEILLFSVLGQNFFTLANFFEGVRLAVEIGLLSLAMTPVILTGGIDLSVGSMMALAAVTFGSAWHDAGLPLLGAVVLALLVGMAGGVVNAFLIARLNVSPLIVTLGTYSLFRGIAEGHTSGARSYSGFPSSFLYLGQGYIAGLVPTQTIIFAAAIGFFWILVHRTVIGRALYAIGLSPSGSRYAAIPVARRLGLVYILSGASAALAGIIYVSHLGQAKSDAGTGYELIAITAVVLGGTSIFGGSGTIRGTLLGLTAIVILQNGLRLSALPAELAGISTGVLLVLTIALERIFSRETQAVAVPSQGTEMRNSQLAILCTTVIVGALIVAGSNWYLVRSLRPQSGSLQASGNRHPVTVAMMPKSKGDPYFISCRAGADEAAKELNINLIWDGPTEVDPAAQNQFVESWITRHVDAIAVSVGNAASISTVLRKARNQGIKVVTWDADSAPDSRDYFVNQATPQGIGATLSEEAAKVLGTSGEYAIITGALSAANQNLWIQYIKEYMGKKYPAHKLAAIRPSDDDRDKAFVETQTLLKVYPAIKAVIVISAPAVPGAAEAVKQSGRNDAKVVGLSLPNLCKPYVHQGHIAAVVLWKTQDLAYLTVSAAAALAQGELKDGASSFTAGRLGMLKIEGSDILLGAPFVFNKSNIGQFNF
jgi:ribose/xylose/arabinose/galactoside ABC-type transport system permease subunit/ABC-type sugar transport system substrate-binding protein